MDKNDASLAGGTIQITAEKNGSGNGFENVGSSSAIIQDDVSAGLQTVQIDATQIRWCKRYRNYWFQNDAVISFKAIVTDKAGNSTSYDVAIQHLLTNISEWYLLQLVLFIQLVVKFAGTTPKKYLLVIVTGTLTIQYL